MTNTTELVAVNEAAIALYNHDHGTDVDTFESVPLSTVTEYRARASAAVGAFATATASTVRSLAFADRIAATALREAADAYRSGQLTGVFFGRDDYPREWLRVRADRIESGR